MLSSPAAPRRAVHRRRPTPAVSVVVVALAGTGPLLAASLFAAPSAHAAASAPTVSSAQVTSSAQVDSFAPAAFSAPSAATQVAAAQAPSAEPRAPGPRLRAAQPEPQEQPPPSTHPETGSSVAFTVKDPRIAESSGLTVSRRHRGIVYTHNDSGGRAQVYAIGPDGRTKATLTLLGATCRDWEAIAAGRDDAGRPALFVADIGDNLGGAWPSVTVYRFPEPAVLKDQSVRVTAFRLKYEDGPRDAEGILVHPKTNRLYVVSKLLAGKLYAAPRRLRTGRINVLRAVGDAPAIATDAAYSPDGRTFAIRTYFAVHIYTAPGRLLRRLRLPEQEQGESLTYSADGRALLVGSEFENQPVWRVPLPKEALPEASPTASGPSTGHPDAVAGGGRHTPGEKAAAMLVVAGVIATGVVAYLRRRSA